MSPKTATKADFRAVSSTELNFDPGRTTDTIVVETTDDAIVEDDELFVVTLTTTNPVVRINKTRAVTTVTITDNDGKCICSMKYNTVCITRCQNTKGRVVEILLK